MTESQRSPAIEVKGVRRLGGRDTTLRVELASGGQDCVVSIHRSLNPPLFDFIAEHGAVSTDPNDGCS